MSSKRGAPLTPQRGGSAVPQQPAAKRARGNPTASVSISPGRFLPCHLVMLRSLYVSDNVATTGASATAETSTQASVDKEVPVTEQVWNLIDVFLSNRDGLATSRDKAIKSWAVYESAERILNEGIGGVGATAASTGSNGVQCGQVSPVPSTPLLRTDKLSSPTGSVGVGTSVNISSTRSDQQHGHMNSWRLVTKLLSRQNEVTQKDTQLVGEPYQPLVVTLNSKLEELRIIYKGLVDDRSSVDGERTQSDDLVQFSSEDEDLVTKLECKIRLWSLLLSSVQGVVGAH